VELQNKVTQETKVEIYKAKLLNQRVDSKIVQTPKKEDPILVREKEISSLEASNIREK
ncbi:16419_t:CDS:1, partial [Gigaspora rosea]